jgi:sulfite reductase (NADPH) flavoprotein alpha-component
MPNFDDLFLKQLAETHSPEQQIWLSGYLYGIAVGGKKGAVSPAINALPLVQETPAAPTVAADKITILYGSQTGNSKKVANLAAAKLRESGREVVLADLNEYATKNLKSEKIVLMVISTQGEGEPPTVAEEFYQWLHSARAPKLDGLQYSVCGLGDRSYQYFCKIGKDLDARMEALGAKRVADRADCDAEYETAAEAWIAALAESLALTVQHAANNNATAATGYALGNGHAVSGRVGADTLTLVKAPAAPQITRKNPFSAPVLEKIQLNGRGSVKETWHLEIGIDNSGLIYEPGDSLGIFPVNPEPLVREVLYAAMLNGNKIVQYNGKEMLFREALHREVELTTLTRETIENYANWSNSSKLKALLADDAALKKFLWGRGIADLLREYPAALSETTLLGMLRKMQPRMYSIASSLAAHPDEVHLTVAAVRYQYDNRMRWGAASTWLADHREPGDFVPVFVEQNEYFKLPKDDAQDIIMVGPGTGVAPFRAFTEERAERGASGKNWLFFGNPNFETDFLYQTEWLKALKNGTLDRLDVAFSRDQKDKIYVQQRLLERSKLIFERLENGANLYVCGDKTRMAADVQQAILQIVTKESGKDEAFAADYLKNLKKQRRYLEDVY